MIGKYFNPWGAWIAEWSSHSTNEHQYAVPCPGLWCQSLVTTILFRLKHNIYTQLSEKQNKQLLILIIVKKLLNFVLFMKVCWKSRKWRIELFLKRVYLAKHWTYFENFVLLLEKVFIFVKAPKLSKFLFLSHLVTPLTQLSRGSFRRDTNCLCSHH